MQMPDCEEQSVDCVPVVRWFIYSSLSGSCEIWQCAASQTQTLGETDAEKKKEKTQERGAERLRERERGVQQKALLQNLVSRLLPDAFEGGIRHVSGTLSGERYICSMSVWYANRKVSVWAVSKRNLHSIIPHTKPAYHYLYPPPPPPPPWSTKGVILGDMFPISKRWQCVVTTHC